MAHNTVPLSALTLVDNWPGSVNPNRSKPTDGWDNTVDNFTTTSAGQTPSVPVGTKIMAYTDNSYNPGWYTMMMLKYHTFEDSDISVKDYSGNAGICCHYDASDAEDYNADFSMVPYYVICNDITNTDAANIGTTTGTGIRIAFPCATVSSDGTSAYTNGYGDAYVWSWVGGVCPCLDATLLDASAGGGSGAYIGCGSMVTSGSVVAGFSTTSIFLEAPDVSAFSGADASEGGNVPCIVGFLDTSGA